MIGAGQLDASAGEVAGMLGAQVRGEAGVRLTSIAPLEQAGAGALGFVRDARHAGAWVRSKASAALVTADLVETAAMTPGLGRALLIVADADRALVTLLREIEPPPYAYRGVHPSAVVEAVSGLGEGVSIGPNSSIGPGTTIGAGTMVHARVTIGAEVRIGRGCVLMPGVVIYDRCVIGDGVIIHANAVIGADGFGYIASEDGRGLDRVPHIGTVEIGDRVEIGAGSCIDRGKLGATRIGSGTKIDNLVQIGHNVEVGRSCIICGCSGLAGSVVVGDGVTIAAQVGIADNLSIGAGATLGARSGVMHNVPAGETWLGLPAQPAREMMKIYAAERELPEILRRVKRLEEQAAGGVGGDEA